MTKPKYPSFEGSERELLENHLEHNRLTVRHKVGGLSIELASKQLGNSLTAAAGIVKLGCVKKPGQFGMPICPRSLVHPRIYLHMIEEIARHNGHLDIYLELLDGTTDRD